MSTTNLASELKNISEKDRKQIEQAQEMLGPDPSTMGVVKNYFWGNFREEILFPYPAGASAYFRYIDGWRKSGKFEGLEFA